MLAVLLRAFTPPSLSAALYSATLDEWWLLTAARSACSSASFASAAWSKKGGESHFVAREHGACESACVKERVLWTA
jgi:hypothetical protein